MPRTTGRCAATLTWVLAFTILSAGCTSTSNVATIPCIGYTPTSGSATLTTQTGSGSQCSLVAVEVLVSVDLLEAAFRVTFDASKFRYAGASETGTILAQGGAGVLTIFPDPLDVELSQTPGEVVIGLSRQPGAQCDQAGQPTCEAKVTGSQLLVTLFFKPFVASGATSAMDLIEVELNDGQAPPMPITPVNALGGELKI